MKESISPRQVAAITLAGYIGKQLQKEHPEISEFFLLFVFFS